MHVKTFLHKVLGAVMHKSRLKMLIPLVSALIKVKSLKLTTLGRALDLPIQERSAIRKVDKYLSNIFFQKKTFNLYGAIIKQVIGSKKRPQIIVDWTKLPHVNEYALRAALVAEGRAITLYEEVHSKKEEQTTRVHNLFLSCLKQLLPIDCRPIVITDAGFKNPWFKAVLNLGWDFVGRVRGLTKYKDGASYKFCETLHKEARITPKFLGNKILSKSSPLNMFFYIVRQKMQGRKKRTRSGKICVDKDSRNYSRGYREPWLLVSSIKGYSAAKKVVQLYKRRMTIEEGFRDLKSSQYGFSMQENKTEKRERLIVWLLLAALASLFAWLVGRAAENMELHYQFQANSIRHRRVLSLFYLGCEVIKKKINIPINLEAISFVNEEIYI